MDRNDTKHDSNVKEDINQTTAVNAIPLTVILLLWGHPVIQVLQDQNMYYYIYSISGWLFQKYVNVFKLAGRLRTSKASENRVVFVCPTFS